LNRTTNIVKNQNTPIDAVIIWVNGDDSSHKEKLNKYLQSIGHVPKMANATRFRETGELEYCIASLLQYSPWIRKVFIVSDAQTPSFMSLIEKSSYSNRIEVVDHLTIFSGYEENLPTFNSRSIASLIWRIPGLSENYLFLNDDFILIRPVSPNDFFNNDCIVVRGTWKFQHKYRLDKLLIRIFCPKRHKQSVQSTRPKLSHAQASAATIAGYKRRFFSAPHVPHPQLKSLLQKFYSEHTDILNKNIKFRIRSNEQFLPDALTTHLAFYYSKAEINNKLKSMILKMGKISNRLLRYKLALARFNRRLVFVCIQDLERAKPKTRKILIDWLNSHVGKLTNLIHE
jgi:hypothetical protein